MTDHKIDFRHVLVGLLVSTINSLQSRVNGELGAVTGDGTVAALVSFGGGWVLIAALVLSSSAARSAFLRLPQIVKSGQLKWWQCIGGMAGAIFVIGQGFVVPVVGVSIFVISVVAGQAVSSLLVDKIGLGPAGAKQLTALRIFAAGLAVVGVAISVLGRDSSHAFSLPLVMYAFGSGMLSAAQYAINGRVAVATGQPMATTLLNFSMGIAALTAVLSVQWLIRGSAPVLPPAPWEHPELWLGGPLGVLFIVSAAVLVRSLGVLVFSLVSVVGQISGALLLDVFLPTEGTHVGFQLILGVLVTASAVILASKPPKRVAG